MDTQHAPEFASERYFDKLKRLSESRDGVHENAGHHSLDASTQASSTFILPIQARPRTPEYATHEPHKAEKRRNNFSFRSILPSRSSVEHDARRLSAEVRPKKTFDQLFLALPNELQIQVIAALPLSDVLSLRTASRAWHTMITTNELPIARYHLEYHVPAYAKRLYPVAQPSDVKLHYLCAIWHRLHVAAKLAFLISERVTKEIFLRETEAQRSEFAPQNERMRRRLIPLLFTMFHFFETYRTLHLDYIKEHGHGLAHEPYTMNPIEVKIMNMYDDQTLLRVHQVFPLVISSFCRRLRPPSYAGRLERSIRGYLKDPPSDNVYVAAMCVGGMRQVEKFWEIKGYNSRRGAIDNWFSSIVREPTEVAAKPRRFMSLGRKFSNIHIGDAKDGIEIPSTSGRFRRGSDANRRNSDASASSVWDNSIFDSSLLAGMPMGPLSREQLHLLLPELPLLQQIWLPTAEALIYQRQIVSRPEDIKRNAQVLLELIREDGAAEEDAWWYGQAAPDSVRPPLEAIEEDPIE
ncbi:F-box-like domain-containing protein [Microdochium nivale]|nr:F-box-like domain-containing protein [Microdochium nivale]